MMCTPSRGQRKRALKTDLLAAHESLREQRHRNEDLEEKYRAQSIMLEERKEYVLHKEREVASLAADNRDLADRLEKSDFEVKTCQNLMKTYRNEVDELRNKYKLEKEKVEKLEEIRRDDALRNAQRIETVDQQRQVLSDWKRKSDESITEVGTKYVDIGPIGGACVLACVCHWALSLISSHSCPILTGAGWFALETGISSRDNIDASWCVPELDIRHQTVYVEDR